MAWAAWACRAFTDASDEKESIATIHAALEAGINLFDTGDFYGMGHNELLLQKALAGRAARPLFSSALNSARCAPHNGNFVGIDARPAAVKNFLAYTLKRLGTDHVDLYQAARVDPNVPIEDTIGAIAEMVKAGYVRHVGFSEASSETIRRAHAVHPIVGAADRIFARFAVASKRTFFLRCASWASA